MVHCPKHPSGVDRMQPAQLQEGVSFLSCGGRGKIKLTLTTLPRIFGVVGVCCRWSATLTNIPASTNCHVLTDYKE